MDKIKVRQKTKSSWKILSKLKSEVKDFQELEKILLENRNIGKKDHEKFLHPQYEDLFDPFLFSDMKKALIRFIKAVINKENIIIYGDYDVDGVTSVSLLINYFKTFGIHLDYYIPDRNSEGFGMNKDAVQKIIDSEKDYKLLIAVDNGSSTIEEIANLSDAGIDVVVMDHHELMEHKTYNREHKKKKQRMVIINHKNSDEKYPESYLTAVGIVFKFIQAFERMRIEREAFSVHGKRERIFDEFYEMMKINKKYRSFPKGFEKWFLDLVALGTVCDCQPLLSENRILACYGLKVLQKTRNLGLHALIDVAGLRDRKLSSYDLGFILGPRLNASGRLAHASAAVTLLTSDDEKEVRKTAEDLHRLNYQRRQETEMIVKQIEEHSDQYMFSKVVFASSKRFKTGLAGLVASKLLAKYNRTAFVAEEKDSGLLHGSIRGADGVNVIETLTRVEQYLESFGGHRDAGGFRMKKENREAFVHAVDKNLVDQLSSRSVEQFSGSSVECVIDSSLLNNNLLKLLYQFCPFGVGNEEPVFLLENIQCTEARLVGKDQTHLKLLFRTKDNQYLNAIWFYHEYEDSIESLIGKKVSIAFRVQEDTYRGGVSLVITSLLLTS